ncbi:MAG TPA: sulfatase-like hydrolase/transferase [Opitutales bacterium]|nr:sulfatase-like hydrolase/transferase [Opitutales bacterium]
MMTRFACLPVLRAASFLLVAILVFSLAALPLEADSDKRPNIIIIFIDDLARGDVGAFGCPESVTPNIDRLADQGVRLTNAYTQNAPCSPSRAALMMGMYTQRFGKYNLSRGVPIPRDKPTLAETLRDADYITGIVGMEKWDMGSWDQGPLDRGFMEAGMHPPRVEGQEGHGGGPSYMGIDGSYLTEVEGGYCVDFIRRHGKGERPFFLYFVPLAVHIPNDEVPAEYLEATYPGHEGDYAPREYLRASLFALDFQIGKILDTLREMGLCEDTLIFFSSDNGGDPAAGHRPLPYRGGKRHYNMQWEGNYRMPTIVSFPGTLEAGRSYDGMSSTIDFYPTAAALAGTPVPEHCVGVNLLPLLQGDVQPNPDRIIFWNTHGSQIIRWKQWRAVKYRNEKSWRLHDIEADPAENRDLAKTKPEVLASMVDRYAAWLAEMAEPVDPVVPPEEFFEATRGGRQPRRPYGRGWMTVEKWDKIKHDATQWSEAHVRDRMLEEMAD